MLINKKVSSAESLSSLLVVQSASIVTPSWLGARYEAELCEGACLGSGQLVTPAPVKVATLVSWVPLPRACSRCREGMPWFWSAV